MEVNGYVRISLSLNVYDLETDAVYIDSYGRVKISDPDAFFVDWSDNWENGIGELIGASEENVDLEVKPDEEDYPEDDEEDENI